MSSDNWRFGVDDVGSDSDSSSSSNSSASASDAISLTSLLLLPLSVAGVYAFVQESAVLTALQTFLGTTGFAAALTTALWVIGLVTVIFIGIMAVLTVVMLLTALVRRDVATGIVGFLGLVYFGVGSAGAMALFGQHPFLVGFILTTNVVLWVVIAIAALIGGLVFIALVG